MKDYPTYFRCRGQSPRAPASPSPPLQPSKSPWFPLEAVQVHLFQPPCYRLWDPPSPARLPVHRSFALHLHGRRPVARIGCITYSSDPIRGPPPDLMVRNVMAPAVSSFPKTRSTPDEPFISTRMRPLARERGLADAPKVGMGFQPWRIALLSLSAKHVEKATRIEAPRAGQERRMDGCADRLRWAHRG